MDNKQWFKEAKFGMMVHFGLYSVLGGEWKGQRMPFIGEWAQSYFRIPNSEYSKLTNVFNPIFFNAEEWVKLAKESGMKYIVVTSKHHEGFALFKSEWDNYNVVDGTPFKRDIISELAEACYKYDLKLGLYYSQELDWHDPNGGGYKSGHTNCNCMSWTNDWDYPDNDKKDYSLCFEGKIKTQLKEILTKYGDLCLIWCDTPHVITESQSREIYDMIKKYQPNALVNSRIGNGLGDYRSTGDNQIEFDSNVQGEEEGVKTLARRSEALVRTGLFECPATLNDTWGYKSYDNNWKNADKIIELKKSLNNKGINYLLNVGPDALGRIPGPSIDILRKVGKSL